MGLVPVADLLHDFSDAVKWTFSGLCTIAALCFFARAAILTWRDEESSSQKDRPRKMIGLIGMLVCGVGFIGFASYYFWPSATPKPVAQNPIPPISSSQRTIAPASEPNGVYKYIVDGLTKARTDLLSIKKNDLSCSALAAWQGRADTATRLAWANNIQIHNAISQHLGACQNITDIELLNAIRMSVVGLLDRGIQAAKAGGG